MSKGRPQARIMFIDDDLENVSSIKELFGTYDVELEYMVVDNVIDAAKATGQFDVIVIDISAVTPLNLLHTAYSPVCMLIEKRPGTPIVINSAVGCPEDIVEDVLRRQPDAIVKVAGIGSPRDGDIDDVVMELLGVEDTL